LELLWIDFGHFTALSLGLAAENKYQVCYGLGL
jgi:hypothetical protein